MKWNKSRTVSGTGIIFAGILVVIGIISLIGANLTGIGVFLYQWGKLDLEIGPSVWSAFVIWVQMIGIGLLSFLSGQMILWYSEK